ncbi:facilitated trehalose transporter Tret1-like [Euwallacea similis]|uniref:facilitated trehalose transporter Tret1-like n=1 Tax=Euwallacea similis TaxID=1736056 RepID=UPI00344D5F4E
MTRPVLLSENSRSILMTSAGVAPPSKLPQFIAAFVSTISAVCLGMVFSWTSSAIPALQKEMEMTSSQGAWVGSLVTVGAFAGAIPAGPLCHLLGRKTTLQVLIAPLFISWIIIAFFYRSLYLLYFARFLAGISSGGVSVAVPMYVSELAHISIRGTLGTFFQVQITIGILIEYLLGDIVPGIRTLSLVSSVLPIVFLLAFAFVPESPVYLCQKAKFEEAHKSLTWFRGQDYNIEDELVNITEELKEGAKNKTSLSDLVSCKATSKGLIIAFGLMAFQQLSGVNAVLFYSNDIFQQGGMFEPGTCSVLMGIAQVIATLCSAALIDRAGRRILLILSDSIMCLSLAVLGTYFYLSDHMDLTSYSFIPLFSVISYIIFFSVGFGPIPWMIMSEIFHPKVKGTASSISASLNWLLAFLVTNQFSNLTNYLGIGLGFIVFSIICGFGTLFVVLLVPETKGKTIEEVMDVLRGEHQGGLSESYEKSDKTTTTV